MKKHFFCLMAMMGVQTISAQNANDGYDMTMSIDMSSHEADISPTLYGVFFEEINHAGEGGLYGELLGNRSFAYICDKIRIIGLWIVVKKSFVPVGLVL